MNTLFSLQHQVSLKTCNSFGIDALAEQVLSLSHQDQLPRLHHLFLQDPSQDFLFLGGGSNVVLPDHLQALVVHVQLKGRRILEHNEQQCIIAGAAGENWHDFVLWSIEQGCGGLENLSLIPGTVGAAPIQNIGAYGRELKDYFHSALVFDVLKGEFSEFFSDDCAFAYRDSIFKKSASRHLLIVEVRFALPKLWKAELSYGDVAQRLKEQGITSPNPKQVSDVICAIRRSKLPDPAELGNAGSFFKNPIVNAELREQILAAHTDCVSYPLPDGQFKLAAGWLIERAGWKGRQQGRVGVYHKQALVLVNHGGATGQDIRAIASEIQADVARLFGVSLEAEPVFV